MESRSFLCNRWMLLILRCLCWWLTAITLFNFPPCTKVPHFVESFQLQPRSFRFGSLIQQKYQHHQCFLLRPSAGGIKAERNPHHRGPFQRRQQCYGRHSNRICLHERSRLSCEDDSDPDTGTSNGETSLRRRLEQVANYYKSKTSMQEVQKDLARRGISFVESALTHTAPTDYDTNSNMSSTNQMILSSAFRKVLGCTANVHVRLVVEIRREGEGDSNNQHIVLQQVQGHADAILSRGLLSLVAALLNNQPVADILALDPFTFADQVNLRQALSPGRNDGLASMIRTIQHLLQQDVLSPLQLSSISPSQPNKPLEIHVQPPPEQQLHYSAATESPRENKEKDDQPPLQPVPTVALLLSGGVDSSVALHLLLQQHGRYNVTAFYLKIWLQDELAHLGTCPWEDDYNVCQAVCQAAGVPLEAVSLQQEYQNHVISYTIQEAAAGRTPNPDILCNSRIKFGCFYDLAIRQRQFDYVATGHYAQVIQNDKDCSMKLLRAPDPIKDQSYFLCTLTQEQLHHVLFPIGHLQKHEVRQLAETSFDLPNKNRPDSQGLCFLGKVKFEDFLAAQLGERRGPIVDAATGAVLGQHKGVWFHTVGQRKGIGKVLDPIATSRGPWYVVAKDPVRDIVYCSNQYNSEQTKNAEDDDNSETLLFEESRTEFTAENIHWIAHHPPAAVLLSDEAHPKSLRLLMKIRHGPKLVTGTLTFDHVDEAARFTCANIKLDHKDSGLAPGQYVVFYQGEECLGGGVISERHWTKFQLQQQQQQRLEQKLELSTAAAS